MIIMGFAELFILAVGLSMDAFAVSICKGLSIRALMPRHAMEVATASTSMARGAREGSQSSSSWLTASRIILPPMMASSTKAIQ